MATRTLKASLNCVFAQWKIRAPTIKRLNTCSKRYILSSSYGKNYAALLKGIEEKKQGDEKEQISTICLSIDRCSEKGQPFSSITLDRMVNAIEDSEDIKTSLYYIYKFRHGETSYFIRPWTIHMWIRKCIACNEMDMAMQALRDNVHYGIFPDEVSFDLLIDYCLKKQEYSKAFVFASHMFLSENLHSHFSQILSLVTINHFVDCRLDPENIFQVLSKIEDKRNFGGICYRLGQLMKVKSLELIGLTILGSIEKEHGIRAVYQEPWGPLVWKEGYLGDALSLVKSTDSPVSQEATNILLDVAKNDEELLNEINVVVAKLEEENLINNDESFSELVNKYMTHLESAEESNMTSFSETVKSWMSEDNEMREIEQKIFSEWKIDQEKLSAEQLISRTAKKMAVEKLGYWELLGEVEDDQECELHLRKDYVSGSLSDIDIERRRLTDEAYYYKQ